MFIINNCDKSIREYYKVYLNSILIEDLILEDVPKNKEEIIKSIKNNDFDLSKENFRYSLTTALKRPHGIVLSSYSIDDLAKMKTFKVKGIAAGFALKVKSEGNGYDIVSVHNSSGIKGLGSLLMDKAIELGGKYLDCFEGFLPDFYKSKGFIIYREEKYNSKYDPDGKLKKALGGERSVVYMKLKGAKTPNIY